MENKFKKIRNASVIKIVSRLFLILSVLLYITTIFAVDDGSNLINDYYSSFKNKNLENYLNTQYLENLNQSELKAKKDLILKIWNRYDISYKIKLNNKISKDGVIIVDYNLSSNLKDLKTDKFSSKNVDMTAIIVNTTKGFKIYDTLPTIVFNKNVLGSQIIVDSNINSSVNSSVKKENMHISNVSEAIVKESQEIKPVEVSSSKVAKCKIDYNLTLSKPYSLASYPKVKTLVGDNKILKVVIGDEVHYYKYINNQISSLDLKNLSDNYDYLITIDSCAFKRIVQGADPIQEYNNNMISITSNSILTKMKLGIGNFFFKIYSYFFNDNFEFWIEAESAKLKNKGRYTLEGDGPRGEGELYLGTGGSEAVYNFSIDEDYKLYLYARVSDDGLHKDGARSVVFNIDGKKIVYNSKSQKFPKVWKWVYIGEYDLKKGSHKMIILKPKQTSAAFIADKFKFTTKKN